MSTQRVNSGSGWGDESFEPWAGQSIAEDAEVFVPVGARAQIFRGRVALDGQWVHVQTATERMSFSAVHVRAVRWATSRENGGIA